MLNINILIAEMVNRIRNGMCPEYLQKFIVSKDNNFNLRAVDSLSVPKFNMVTYGKGSFRYSAPYYWNKLPNVLKNEMSFNHFKSVLRDWRPNCLFGSYVLCNISLM